jgi:hypothetical protein
MRTLATEEWLNIWEVGLTQRPAAWALALLAAACPDLPAPMLAQLSIGQRDARLLSLRESLFGSQMATLTECPLCDEQLELTFELQDIRTSPQADPVEASVLCLGEWQVRFRLPNSLDLLAVAGLQDIATARQALYQRCILHAEQGGEAMSVDRVPEDVVARVSAQMAQLDPQGDVQLALTCPACAHQWLANLDIARFLWAELDAWALRMLRDVHSLAAAYGWREADILAMSPWRRQIYLELIG